MRNQNETVSEFHQVDLATQDAHLASLKSLLERIQTQPCMGELAPALLSLLGAGRIVCKCGDRGDELQTVFAAEVTPAEIRKLLPLVTHRLRTRCFGSSSKEWSIS